MYHMMNVLEASALLSPIQIAFSDEEEEMCFAALLETAKRVGSGLLDKMGHKQGVAVLMDDRKCHSIAALMGVACGGGFYAPLNTRMPMERLRMILSLMQPAVILYDQKGEKAALELSDEYVCVNYKQAASGEADVEGLASRRKMCGEEDPLFVLYTSGSTGVPKGVIRSHRSLCLHNKAVIDRYGFTKQTVFGNQCPLYYANCVMDIYPSIALGATNHLLPAQALSFPKTMIDLLNKYKINELTMTPSSYTQLAQAQVLQPGCLPHLHCLIQTGEPASWETMETWQQAAPLARFWNLYGSTEVYSVAAWNVEVANKSSKIPPVGAPFSGVELLFLDDEGQPIEETKGEIAVYSPWLADGYYKENKKTAAAFLPINGKRYFRTGDNGFLNELGQLVLVGRMDGQIKHKGYRMELGEVEYAMGAIIGFAGGCCLYDKERERIGCFWIGDLTQKEMQRQLKLKLPRYALPDVYIHLEQLPFTTNGKIDRQLLQRNFYNLV